MELHYTEAGEGVPLVLIHGFPLDHALWQPQLEGLSRVARMVAPDLRGFGKSPQASGVVSMEDHAGDVVELLDRLNIGEAVVCGLSMGGYVALAIAELFPRVVKGLILCNTRSVADDGPARRMREITALRALEGGTAEMVPGMVTKLLGPHSAKAVSRSINLVSDMLLRQPATGWAASSRGMAERPDRTPLLSNLRIPALVITGRDDALIPPAESETMTAHLPKGRLVVIPRVGHLTNLEAPEAFNRVVKEFLATAC